MLTSRMSAALEELLEEATSHLGLCLEGEDQRDKGGRCEESHLAWARGLFKESMQRSRNVFDV